MSVMIDTSRYDIIATKDKWKYGVLRGHIAPIKFVDMSVLAPRYLYINDKGSICVHIMNHSTTTIEVKCCRVVYS